MDDGIQDDGELIQRNLVQDPDILMMISWRVKEESDWDKNQSKS